MGGLGYTLLAIAGALWLISAVLHAIADRGREDVIWELSRELARLRREGR